MPKINCGVDKNLLCDNIHVSPLHNYMSNNTTLPNENQDKVIKHRHKFTLICASKCKKFALEYAKANRAQGFTRVSEEFLIAIEASVRNSIQNRINQHPSKGKTLT